MVISVIAFMAHLTSERLNLTTKIAYGAGDLGPAITANISVFYLLFFLTDVAGLPAGLAGSVLMVVRIFDSSLEYGTAVCRRSFCLLVLFG